jgi:hypothetical protein
LLTRRIGGAVRVILGNMRAFPWMLGLLLSPSVAWALPPFQDRIPNGHVHGCATCHTSTNEDLPSWNAFGEDVRRTLRDGVPDWTAVRQLDSDCDGQPNDLELGDPCDAWVLGASPARTDAVSLPGDATSTTTAPACSTASLLDAGACTPVNPDSGGLPLGDPPDAGPGSAGHGSAGHQGAAGGAASEAGAGGSVVSPGSDATASQGGCALVAGRAPVSPAGWLLAALAGLARRRRRA